MSMVTGSHRWWTAAAVVVAGVVLCGLAMGKSLSGGSQPTVERLEYRAGLGPQHGEDTAEWSVETSHQLPQFVARRPRRVLHSAHSRRLHSPGLPGVAASDAPAAWCTRASSGGEDVPRSARLGWLLGASARAMWLARPLTLRSTLASPSLFSSVQLDLNGYFGPSDAALCAPGRSCFRLASRHTALKG